MHQPIPQTRFDELVEKYQKAPSPQTMVELLTEINEAVYQGDLNAAMEMAEVVCIISGVQITIRRLIAAPDDAILH